MILILFLILCVNVIYDYWTIEVLNEYVNHSVNVITVAIFVMEVSLIWWYFDRDFIYVASCLIMLPSVRWIFHSLSLNLLRGKKWDYMGLEGKDDSKLDILLGNLKIHPMFVKIVTLLISLWIVFLIN